MYPVEFQTQSDLSGRVLGDSLMDEVEDVYLYILHALVSISMEMSRHLGLLCIVCYLVKVPLKPVFETIFGLADVLFPTSRAGYTVHQIVAIAADVVLPSVFLTPD